MADTWISVDDANIYFGKSFEGAFWASLIDSSIKDKLLFSAKNLIQSLGYTIAEDNTDENVKKAQCETAKYIYENTKDIKKRRALYAMGVRRFMILNFQEYLSMEQLPVNITNLLQSYLTNKSTFIQKVTRKIIRG